MILITSILFFNSKDAYIELVGEHLFALSSIVTPFVWIIFAKLYNNEFTSFKSDISTLAQKGSIEGIPSTPRSLYHFQNGVIASSFAVIGSMIYLNHIYKDEEDPNHQFKIAFFMQIIFACIMVVNGVFTLASL